MTFPCETDMTMKRARYFRWTPRTTWLTFAYVVVVPSIFGYMGYVTDVSGSSPWLRKGVVEDVLGLVFTIGMIRASGICVGNDAEIRYLNDNEA